MTVIAKYSDYSVQSIEYFIDAIKDELALRDISGLTRNTIQKINVTKQHPLVTLMDSSINPNKNLEDTRSSILPAISVTPGNQAEEAATMGKSYQPFTIDDDWITEFKEIANKTQKEILKDGLITVDQANAIMTEYRRGQGVMRCQKHMWGWNEEINVSLWSDSPDVDVVIATLLDSIFSEIAMGTVGDNSALKNMKYKPTKGLTNFNFGRVLFGTEYNLTFFNTYHNYTIFTEDLISGHDLQGTFTVPGSTETWQTPTE